MTLLRNTVTEPDGSPLNGWLDVAIVGNPFRPATQTEVLGPVKDRQIVAGAWSVDLAPGLYAVTQRRRDGAFHSRWTVEVPDSATAVWLADCLVTVPGTPASVLLRAVTSATVDGAGHLQVAYSDGSTVDAGPVIGPQGPPWTGSATEFGQAIADEVDDETSPANASLRAAFEAVVKVDTFGAVGDGTADDAAAFQAAIDAVSAAGGGVLMCTRAKTYKLRNVRLKAKVAFDLNGATIQYGGTNGTVAPLELEPAILYAEGTAGSPLEGIVVRGGTFRGIRAAGDYNATQAGHHDGVQFNHTRAGLIENCVFIDIPQDPITFGGSTAGSSAGTTARGNYIKDCGDAAIEVRTGSDYLIIGNTAVGVRNLVASKPNVDRVTILGNKGQTFAHGIIGHGSDWIIQGNTIGTFVTADAQDGATVAGVHVSDQGGGSFTAADCARWTITGNTITGRASSQALELPTGGTWNVSDVIFKNNNVVARRGVLASKGTGVYVSGNRLNCGAGGGVQVNGTATKVSVIDNDIDATAGNGVDVTVAASPIIIGNRITTAAVGINLGSAATDARVEANTVAAATSALTAFGTRASLRGNRCTTTGGATISLSGADAVVDGNTLSPTGGEGVLIQAGATAAVVTGNRVIGGTQGIRVGGNDGTVVGNRCSGAQFWGVNISTGVTGALLTGNHLKGNTSGAISDSGTGTTTGTNITA